MPVGFINLGRAGDTLNILPMVRAEAQRLGAPVPVHIAAPYAPILARTTYAQAVPQGNNLNAVRATYLRHRGRYDRLYVPQAYGDHIATRAHQQDSFAIEQYDRCNMIHLWGAPLILDARRHALERAAIEAAGGPWPSGRPIILANLAGKSGRLPPAVAEAIGLALATGLPGAQIVRLDSLRAACVGDLLGLYELAAALVTIDTATYHLARAVPALPVVYLHPEGWTAAPARETYADFTYDQAGRDPEAVAEATKEALCLTHSI